MRVTKVLEAQHRAIEKLFARLLGSANNQVELVAELARHVLTHMIVEQTVFYPAVFSLAQDFVLDSIEEHAVARFQLRRLLGTTDEGARLHAKVRILRELVLRHIDEEEKVLFPRLGDALHGDREDDLAERLIVASEELFTKDLDLLLLRSKKTPNVEPNQDAAA